MGAWAESFNATLKNERVHRMAYPTKDKTTKDVGSWIEMRYNYARFPSAFEYHTPNEVKREFLGSSRAA